MAFFREAGEESIAKVTLVAIILLAIVAAYTIIGSNQKAAFSQLYLDETSLPSKVSSETPFSFKFVAENFEGKTVEYRYQVLIDDSLDHQKTFSLEDGKRATLTESAALKTTGRHKVSVILEKTGSSEKPLSVFFRVESA